MLFTCCFMVSSLSSCTPMFRTLLTGWTVSDVTVMVKSWSDNLSRFARDPNHISSVLLAFSCSRLNVYHPAMSVARSDSCCRTALASLTWPLTYACLSSANKWNYVTYWCSWSLWRLSYVRPTSPRLSDNSVTVAIVRSRLCVRSLVEFQ